MIGKIENMKNIHVLSTNKPSRLSDCHDDRLHLDDVRYLRNYKNIYITSDEEIIGGKEWFLDLTDNSLFKNQTDKPMSKVLFPECKKIVLTTDQNLINDGIEQISEDTLLKIVEQINSGKNISYSETYGLDSKLTEQEWFEQFKK